MLCCILSFFYWREMIAFSFHKFKSLFIYQSYTSPALPFFNLQYHLFVFKYLLVAVELVEWKDTSSSLNNAQAKLQTTSLNVKIDNIIIASIWLFDRQRSDSVLFLEKKLNQQIGNPHKHFKARKVWLMITYYECIHIL